MFYLEVCLIYSLEYLSLYFEIIPPKHANKF